MVAFLLELILTKKTSIFLELSMKYLDTSNNQLKNQTDRISMRLLRLEFKSDNTIKSKAMKYTVKKYCLIIS